MRRFAVSILLMGTGLWNLHAQTPVNNGTIPTVSSPVVTTPAPSSTLITTAPNVPILSEGQAVQGSWGGSPVSERGFLQSDQDFANFIGPTSNPILTKDPRSLTEARFLFLQNWIPNSNPVGGDFQVYALQLRLALTERLQIFADKDGIMALNPAGAPGQVGLLDLAFGAKYALVRDVENQFLVTAGVMYEVPTGYANVFQNHGSGLLTVFGVAGKEIENFHLIANAGYQFGTLSRANSDFFYAQLHLDRQFLGWLYPLVECNWYGYTSGGDRGIPAAVGEGEGLVNLGTSDMAGRNLVTIAGGLKAKAGNWADIGLVYETPMSTEKFLLQNRIIFEFILRY
ncbi:MAG: hypothetical protein ACKO23_07275 [Gemmataceae bacterium]